MKSCARCHIDKNLNEFGVSRNRKDGKNIYCLECKRLIGKEYYKNNKERVLASNKKSDAKNPERVKAKAQRYRERHPDRIKEAQAKYNKTDKAKIKDIKYRNSEKRKEYNKKYIENNYEKYLKHGRKNSANRRVKKSGNGVFTISNKDIKRLLSSPCNQCGSYDKIHLDHVIPVSRGGRHSIGNLQPLCQRCNLSKHDKLNIEWKHWKQKIKEVI